MMYFDVGLKRQFGTALCATWQLGQRFPFTKEHHEIVEAVGVEGPELEYANRVIAANGGEPSGPELERVKYLDDQAHRLIDCIVDDLAKVVRENQGISAWPV